MPRMDIQDPDMQVLNANGNFQFSAVRPEKLEATEYTLVTIVVDTTGSVWDFADELLNSLKTVIQSCKKSPRSENLMVRVTNFNNKITEVHGFKLLSMIDENKYPKIDPSGSTALYDATEDGISSVVTYAQDLVDQDFDVNGIVFIITDGEDNTSKLAKPKSIQKQIQKSIQDETIESMNTVLIGINTSTSSSYLKRFKTAAGFTQYVDAGKATANNLAKLANFVSESISSQSQAIGTGGASQPLTF
ncbi:MAG: putative secreted protein [bacterium]|jgi:predicted secreted protein